MGSDGVVIVHIFSDTHPEFPWIFVLVYVDILGFQASEPSFNDDIVDPTRLTVHALPNALFLQKGFIDVTGKLTALVGVDDPGLPMPRDGIPHGFQYRCGVQ